MRRALEIEGTDIVMELSKITRIKNDGFKSIHFDLLPDGTYRLTYGSGIIDNITTVLGFKFIRED